MELCLERREALMRLAKVWLVSNDCCLASGAVRALAKLAMEPRLPVFLTLLATEMLRSKEKNPALEKWSSAEKLSLAAESETKQKTRFHYPTYPILK